MLPSESEGSLSSNAWSEITGAGQQEELKADPFSGVTHSIRRSRITAMFKRGEWIKSVMLLAGHQDARSTLAYDTPSEDEFAAASLCA
jgi:integrase